MEVIKEIWKVRIQCRNYLSAVRAIDAMWSGWQLKMTWGDTLHLFMHICVNNNPDNPIGLMIAYKLLSVCWLQCSLERSSVAPAHSCFKLPARLLQWAPYSILRSTKIVQAYYLMDHQEMLQRNVQIRQWHFRSTVVLLIQYAIRS